MATSTWIIEWRKSHRRASTSCFESIAGSPSLHRHLSLSFEFGTGEDQAQDVARCFFGPRVSIFEASSHANRLHLVVLVTCLFDHCCVFENGGEEMGSSGEAAVIFHCCTISTFWSHELVTRLVTYLEPHTLCCFVFLPLCMCVSLLFLSFASEK